MMTGSVYKKMAVVFLILPMLWLSHRHGLIARFASYGAYPVLKGYQVLIAPLKQWEGWYYSVRALREQLAAASHELTDLRAQNIYLRASMAYLQGVHELRAFNARYAKEGKIAHILARDFSEQSHHFYIDLGAQDAIEKDMVVAYKNNLVGKVSEVYPWYSKVCLITDKHCKVAAYGAYTRTHGIHEGCNQYGTTALSHVSHLTDARKGELVLSSGEGLLFPEGLALGRIASCQTKGLYKEITVKPVCDLRQIAYCSVVHGRC